MSNNIHVHLHYKSKDSGNEPYKNGTSVRFRDPESRRSRRGVIQSSKPFGTGLFLYTIKTSNGDLWDIDSRDIEGT